MATLCFSVIKLCCLWKVSWHATPGIDPTNTLNYSSFIQYRYTVRSVCCYLVATNRAANVNCVPLDVSENSAYFITAASPVCEDVKFVLAFDYAPWREDVWRGEIIVPRAFFAGRWCECSVTHFNRFGPTKHSTYNMDSNVYKLCIWTTLYLGVFIWFKKNSEHFAENHWTL